MFANKYPNTSRTVSGATAVYNTDSILEVNTTSVAATINLGAIAQGYWNTTWKLYVVDKSNNASVNNITINAGAGQTINGASSLVISTNGAGCLIRILNNTAFIVTLTAGGGGGGVSSVGATSPITSSGGANPNISTSMNTNKLIGRGTVGVGVMEEITLGTNLSLSGNTLNAASSLAYLYSVLRMTNPSIVYLPINGTLTTTPRSVLNGTAITNFSSSAGTITGFSPLLGTWQVPATGYYYLSANLIIRLNITDIDSNVNTTGLSWVDPLPAEQGSMAIGIIQLPFGGTTNIVALSNKQHITNQISDINITTSGLISASLGDLILVNVLNKTLINVSGFASDPLIEDMRIEFTIIKVS
jgi:hypothetical protein